MIIVGFGCIGLSTASLPTIAITYAVDCVRLAFLLLSRRSLMNLALQYKPMAGEILCIATVIKNTFGFGTLSPLPLRSPLNATRRNDLLGRPPRSRKGLHQPRHDPLRPHDLWNPRRYRVVFFRQGPSQAHQGFVASPLALSMGWKGHDMHVWLARNKGGLGNSTRNCCRAPIVRRTSRARVDKLLPFTASFLLEISACALYGVIGTRATAPRSWNAGSSAGWSFGRSMLTNNLLDPPRLR